MHETKNVAGKPATGNPQVNIRFPEAVAKALAKDAKKTKTTIQAVVLRIIGEHYGIEVDLPRRGRPRLRSRSEAERRR